MRIAFFGGTFDPPHIGHLAIARAAQQALHLDTILFAPVGSQPLKPEGASASFDDRVAMTRLAIAGQPHFQLSLADAPETTRLNYTAETLVDLRESLDPGDQLFLLLGADSFRALPRWHRGAEIPFLANLIVASRPGEDVPNTSAGLHTSLPDGIVILGIPSHPNEFLLSNASGMQSHLTLLPDLHYEISATQLRQQIQRYQPNQAQLIPESVLAYIRENALYGKI